MKRCRHFLLCALALSALPCQAQPAAELRLVDGLPVDVAEAEFTKARPEAKVLARVKGNQAAARYFLYQTRGVALLGRPVATVGRGFEGGRGCAVGVSMGEFTAIEAKALLGEFGKRFRGLASQRADSRGNHWSYFDADEWFGAAMVAPASELGRQGVTLSWSSKKCDEALAASRWQTRPR
ncbi:exported hypothetical protein [Rubrivivax sp. A210]|uniref:hypothetical protein n=1 Tax=Rubrivivax sp. A210 TaxID=2772301 RepID=UPI0019196B10|nr:hypothetical protein [Rubrivivax sp. A210]CAD5372852.1 exported hypothetical protein [Rubrivivax sp. A210]